MKNALVNAGYQMTHAFKFTPREIRVMRLAVKAMVRNKIGLAERLCRSTAITSLCWEYASKEEEGDRCI